MKSIALLFSLAMLLVGTCGESPPPADGFQLGESFELMIDQTLVNGAADLRVQLGEVSEDSRCPKNTNCVWEGQASMVLLLNDQPMVLILREGKPEQAQGLFDNRYIVEVEALSPYPDGTKTDPATYKLQLKVSSL